VEEGVRGMSSRNLADACVAFLKTVRAVYGVYFDGNRGFNLVHRQQLELRDMMTRMQGRDAEYWDSRAFVYGSHADPENTDAMPLHTVTYRELTARNAADGENRIFLANVCLVSIYQYWEDRYRGEIAAALDKPKADLLVPIMGDLRHYRNSIIHRAGVAVPKVARCEVLRWFGPGERIELTEEHMRTIMVKIAEGLVEVLQQADDDAGAIAELIRQYGDDSWWRRVFGPPRR
jgi:hypothetical protein